MSRGRMVTIDMHQRSKALAAPSALPLPTGAPLLSEEDTAALISKPDALLSGWTPPSPKAPAPVPVEPPPLPSAPDLSADVALLTDLADRRTIRAVALSRLSVDIPPEVHKALKFLCLAEGIHVRDFVLRALASAGLAAAGKRDPRG